MGAVASSVARMDTNEVRRSIVAQGMARLGEELDAGEWSQVASVVVRALNSHDTAAPPKREPDAVEQWLSDVEHIANRTG